MLLSKATCKRGKTIKLNQKSHGTKSQVADKVRVQWERTSAMGLVTVVKTVGCCVGLFLTGEFAGSGLFWVAFVVAGCLKLLHNVFIVAFFWNHRGRYEA